MNWSPIPGVFIGGLTRSYRGTTSASFTRLTSVLTTITLRDSDLSTLAFDIGGTFTDVVIDAHGVLRTAKRLSAGDYQTEGAADGIPGLSAGLELRRATHATTLFTNALIERRGARTALITTNGFGDVLSMGTELRYDLYLLDLDLPEPVVPEELRLEARERIGAGGEVVVPLAQHEIERLASAVSALGVEAVAVVLLNSFRNSSHEQMLVARLRQLRGVSVTASYELLPVIGEYERTSTSTINAYLQPLARTYLSHVRRLLRAVRSPSLSVMSSDGGVIGVGHAREAPVSLLESGPAAGIHFAARLSQIRREQNVLSFDMGGTTAKLCLIEDGRTPTQQTFEAARVFRFRRGSGLPVAIPVVDLIEIGAGGGSIAWIDTRRLVKVGPKSAGADPGPACYGRGGEEPTVTDADLALGFLSSETFLGGAMTLDSEASARALHDRIGSHLGISVVEAAAGIVNVVSESMAAAARRYLAERGVDPRTLTMIAFGGAGPAHASELARRLGIGRILVPGTAGVASAVGLHGAPPAHEVRATALQLLDRYDAHAVEALLVDLERRSARVLEEVGVSGAITTERTADLRFAGQGASLPVILNGDGLDASTLEHLFRSRYDDLFGKGADQGPVELVQLRVRSHVAAGGTNWMPALDGPNYESERLAWSFRRDKMIKHRVVSWGALTPGKRLEGPAILEQDSSTVLVPERSVAVVDDQLTLEIVAE